MRREPNPKREWGAIAAANHSQDPTHELLTKEQLRKRLNLPSTRGVDELVRRRVIPVLRLGHRTIRFVWPDVRSAIDRLTIREVR